MRPLVLDGVLMSWGHDEYLYEVVRQYFYSTKSAHPLPEEPLAIFRYHSFYAAQYPWGLCASDDGP
jgi:inositol oxygenase